MEMGREISKGISYDALNQPESKKKKRAIDEAETMEAEPESQKTLVKARLDRSRTIKPGVRIKDM